MDDGNARSLAAGVVLSLASHVVVLAVVGAGVRAGGWSRAPGGAWEGDEGAVTAEFVEVEGSGEAEAREREKALAEAAPEEPATPEMKSVTLGSPTSTHEGATMSWLGFDEYVAHHGAESVVDQAQLTRSLPGAPGEPGVPGDGRVGVEWVVEPNVTGKVESSVAASQARAVSEADAGPGMNVRVAEREGELQGGKAPEEITAETADGAERAQGETGGAGLGRAHEGAPSVPVALERTGDPAVNGTKGVMGPAERPRDEERREAVIEVREGAAGEEIKKPEPGPVGRASVPPGGGGVPGGGGGGGVGILSDRESVSAAIKSAVDVDQWGRPLSAKGLKIRTVRPKLSKFTELTSRGAPVIRILFNRRGVAVDVQVLRSSGNGDVDRPVVDAAYQWTAEGEELKSLGENPPGTVAIDVRVIR